MIRFIPKRVMQVIGFILLGLCFAIAVYWTISDTGLYPMLRDVFSGLSVDLSPLFAFLVSLLALLLAALALILVMGLFTRMPERPKVSIKQAFDAEQKLGSQMALTKPRDYTPEMRKRSLLRGIVLLIVGGFILPLTAILTLPGTLAHDTLYNFQIVFIVAAPVFIVIGIVMLVRGLRVRWK